MNRGHSSEITSRKNPEVARLRKLLREGSERRAEGAWILEGVRLAREALGSGTEIRRAWVSSRLDRTRWGADVRAGLRGSGVRPFEVVEEILEWVSSLDAAQGVILEVSARPQGVVIVPEAFYLAGCGVQDPGNAGALARVTEAAGAAGLFLVPGEGGLGADPGHPRTLRASAGSLLRLPHERLAADELAGRLLASGCRIAAAEARSGTAHTEIDWTGSWVVAVGGEGSGLPEEWLGGKLADSVTRVHIPVNRVESLNVATAAAVLLFEIARRRSA